MTTARRDTLHHPAQAEHPGLILDCFLSDASENERPDARRKLFQAARTAMGNAGLKTLYEAAFLRWQQLLPADAVLMKFDYVPESKLIIGLGRQNVLEAGLTLHHTYGVPYLPGSAIKGLAAHFAHQVWTDDPEWQVSGTRHAVVFGSPKFNERPDMGGLIEFHDAWITPGTLTSCLVDDVITPHHSGYYTSPEDNVKEASDFDDPVPVPFLAIRAGFVVAVSKKDSRLPDDWLQFAQRLVQESLTTPGWGIGGKTNAGYGLLKFNGIVQRSEHNQLAVPDENPGQGLATVSEQQTSSRKVSPGDYRRDSELKLRLVRKTSSGKWEARIEGTDQQVVIDPKEFPRSRARDFNVDAILTFILQESLKNWTQLKLTLK